MLEYVPGHFEVIRLVRPKLSCTCCERIVQEPAPSRPIDRGLAGPGLLAHVLVAKFADHFRSIGSRRSMRGKGSIWIARLWPAGSVAPPKHWSRWSPNCGDT